MLASNTFFIKIQHVLINTNYYEADGYGLTRNFAKAYTVPDKRKHIHSHSHNTM